nr:chemotaxis protein [Neobacillus sp. Marseille-Q6967]
MTKKIAVAIIHGIGRQMDDFAMEMEEELKKHFAKSLIKLDSSISDPASQLVIKPICWAEIFEEPERILWGKFQARDLDYILLRETMIHVFADAIAYQKSSTQKNFYKKIHDKIDEKLKELADETGAGDAPLCVISHSLGTVIASNHFYDLQQGKRKNEPLENPLMKGETLTLFFTMGSPISLWSISYDEFDSPVEVPAKAIKQRYPNLGKWINFYDRDDIIAYPLEPLYGGQSVKDEQVNAGGMITGWNPLSHGGYWTDKKVIKPIVNELVNTWKEINN